MYNIVYANTIDYNFGLQQRPQHIMNLLAKRGYYIHWVNSTKIKNKMSDKYNNLKVYHDWEVFKKRYVGKIDVLFISWSRRHIDIDELKPKMVIFDNVDNFEDWESTDDIMCKKSDLILCTSSLLFKEKKIKYSDKKVMFVQNGCWSKTEYEISLIKEPEDLKNISHPRILFSGAMAYWCDLNIIKTVAQKYNLIFVGRPWGIEEIPPNVIFLGEKKYKELQGYYKYCDVNLLPFKDCDISNYSNPIKMFESNVYGIPTVATNIPDAQNNKPGVFPSIDTNHFLQNIEYVLKNKDKDNCKNFAKNNDWNLRVNIIEQEINNFLRGK